MDEFEDNYAVPCFEYMPNIPVMIAKVVQEYIRTTPVADGPGCSTKFPLCRTLLYNSNLCEIIAPDIPSWYLDMHDVAEINENRMLEMQKLAWRNCHAEKHGYVWVPLHKFRELLFPRDFSPPGNLYPPEYYDADTVEAEVATRVVVCNGAILGGGRESVVAIDIQTVRIPHGYSLNEFIKAVEVVNSLTPETRQPEIGTRQWSAASQASFAEQVFNKTQMDNRKKDIHPSGLEVPPLEESLCHSDGEMCLNLDAYMSNCVISYDELEFWLQDVSWDVPNNEYICLIQLHSLGGSSVLLRVNHLEKLPPYLENLIMNYKIKKLAVDTPRVRLAMYVSYQLPWDFQHGVYDL